MATSQATGIIRSTPSFSSSSLIRCEVPSSAAMMSLIVTMHERLDLVDRAERVEHRDLHLDREVATVLPALHHAWARVVEQRARHDRTDVHGRAAGASQARRCLDQGRRGGRRVRLAVGEEADDGVVGRRADRHDGVGHAQAVGKTAGRADPDDPLARRAGSVRCSRSPRSRAHPDALHADRLALERAGVAEHAALLVDAAGRRGRRTSRRCTSPAAGRRARARPGRSRTARRGGESACPDCRSVRARHRMTKLSYSRCRFGADSFV